MEILRIYLKKIVIFVQKIQQTFYKYINLKKIFDFPCLICIIGLCVCYKLSLREEFVVETKAKTNKKWKRKKKSKSKVIYYVLGGGIFTAGLAYVGFSMYFTNHFYLNTRLNGVDVSGHSADEVKKMWETDIASYKLSIEERDGTQDVLNGIDVGLHVKWDDTVQKLIEEQSPFLWVKGLFAKDEKTCGTIVEYDEAKLDGEIAKLNCMSKKLQVAPKNAKVSEYSKDNGFTIVDEVEGTKIDKPLLKEGIESALVGLLDKYSIVDAGGYVQPKIRANNEKLNKAVETLNKYAESSVTFKVGDSTTVLDASTFGNWFSVDKKLKVVLDDEKVSEYVTELGRKYNTCYTPKKLKTSYGKTVTISNTFYGWKVDYNTEKAQIEKEIKSGEATTRDLNYLMTANSHGANDYGDSYVEINLTAQHLYLYKNGSMIFDTDMVTGNVSAGNGTPPGAFEIKYTQKGSVLRGLNNDGTRYNTEVDYWMPFNGNIGMHDASWRHGKFGGTIYKTAGSHGCVNLPVSSAKTIFENVSKGYPVLVYELPGTENYHK